MPLPTVSGTLVKDIDPATWGLADGTPLTFANSGLTPVTGSPILRTNIFGTKPAIKATKGSQGFSIPRPVQDDFTLYGVYTSLEGTTNGANWFQAGSLMDCEAPFSPDDFGINLRLDGKLVLGTGNPEAMAVGTADVRGPFRKIITIRRTKATGVMKAYVDGVLDVTLTNNTNSLNATADMGFFQGPSTGDAGGYLARWLAYDDDHNDADAAAVEAYLASEYPDAPSLRSTKTMGYAVLGPIPDTMFSNKTLAYALLGPGGSDLVATKVVAYAVIEEIETLQSQVY